MSSIATLQRSLAFSTLTEANDINGGRIAMPNDAIFTIRDGYVIFNDSILINTGNSIEVNVPIHDYLKSIIYTLTAMHHCENIIISHG